VRRGFLIGVCGRVELAAGGGGEGVRVGVDLDVDAQGGDPGRSAGRFPEGLELAVLLGLERHRGQLAAGGVDHLGGGDRFADQVAV
jgi:hypothetical protein